MQIQVGFASDDLLYWIPAIPIEKRKWVEGEHFSRKSRSDIPYTSFFSPNRFFMCPSSTFGIQ